MLGLIRLGLAGFLFRGHQKNFADLQGNKREEAARQQERHAKDEGHEPDGPPRLRDGRSCGLPGEEGQSREQDAEGESDREHDSGSDRDQADDVTQEAFFRAYRQIGAFRGGRSWAADGPGRSSAT